MATTPTSTPKASFFTLTSTFFEDVDIMLKCEEGVDAFKRTSTYRDIQTIVTEVDDTDSIVFVVPIAAITTCPRIVDFIFSEHISRRYFSYDTSCNCLYFKTLDSLFNGLVDLFEQVLTTYSPSTMLDMHHLEVLDKKKYSLSKCIEYITTSLEIDTLSDTLDGLM